MSLFDDYNMNVRFINAVDIFARAVERYVELEARKAEQEMRHAEETQKIHLQMLQGK